MTHEKRIEIRWRDQDAYRHVNNAVYATYLEECRDEWAERVLEGVGDVWDYVLARVAIDFRQELTQEDEAVIVTCTLERIGKSSLTLRESIRKLDGTLSAEAEAVLVARDRTTGASRPLTDPEREALTAALPIPSAS
jgi:acyl-CoA thioester hydrolase